MQPNYGDEHDNSKTKINYKEAQSNNIRKIKRESLIDHIVIK